MTFRMRTIRRPPPPKHRVDSEDGEFRYKTSEIESFIPTGIEIPEEFQLPPIKAALPSPKRAVYEKDKIVWDKKANIWILVKESQVPAYE